MSGRRLVHLCALALLLAPGALSAQRTQQRTQQRTTTRADQRGVERNVQRAESRSQITDDEWLEDCQDSERRNDLAVFCDVRVERMRTPSGGLRVDGGQNGGVVVIGENRSDIEVHARIQARAGSEANAQDLADEIQIELSSGEIRADGPDTDREESWSVMFVVHVPRRLDLELVAHNGPMSIEDVTGTIDARTQNGPLALHRVSGDVVARAQNGPLSVELTGTRWSGAGLDAETVNGPVTLFMPDGYSAELEAGTVNGPFNTDIPLTVTRIDRRERRVQTTLGNGGPPIRVVTTNGPVSIVSR
jgi:DUF4097 and DUF4098 domain-containing protein YvlB